MHEKRHVLKILEDTKNAIKNEDIIALRNLSNQTIHTASTEQDTDSITLAVVIYSMSKVLERKHQYDEKSCKEFSKFALMEIDNSIKSLLKNDDAEFRNSLQNIINYITKTSGEFKGNVEDVFRKARINKASKIYEHGISMEQTAKLLGISMYDVASYAGQKGISDIPIGKTISAKDRIKLAMDFFR